MSDILTGFNMQGNDPIDDRIVSKSILETLEEYLKRVPVQKRYYGLTFFALDKDNKLRQYTFQTSLIEPTIDDSDDRLDKLQENIDNVDKDLQEHKNDKSIHKTSEEIRSEIVEEDIPDSIARVQWVIQSIGVAIENIVAGASADYDTLKKVQTKIEELRSEMESQLYGDDGSGIFKTLEQVLDFLNEYKDFIVDIPNNFVSKKDIIDNLTTDDATKVLSARQGKILSETLTNYFDSAMQSIRSETDRATNAENRIEAKLDKEIDRSIKEDQRIDSKLDSEINRSTTEDDRLDKKIDAETDRAESEESRIETKLDNEITRSANKDTEHDNRLTALEGETHEQNTDLGTTNSTFQLKYNTGNKIKHESDAISVRNAADTDYVNFIAKNATFKGDLLVEGKSFVTEAETVEIKDNLLLLNKGEVGSGVTKGIAGLEIDRGTEPNYQIIFDESDNRFKAGEIGDIQCLALRDSDDSMKGGMFTSWDSTTKRLKTTNTVPEDRELIFKGSKTVSLFYSDIYEGLALSRMGDGSFMAISPSLEEIKIDSKPDNIYYSGEIKADSFVRSIDKSPALYRADLVNDLTTGGTNKSLTAEQGKILKLALDDTNTEIENVKGSYLPLSGGEMTGNIILPTGTSIKGKVSDSSVNLLTLSSGGVTQLGHSGNSINLITGNNNLKHNRANVEYIIHDTYNLPNPAKLSANQTFTGENNFTAGKFNVKSNKSTFSINDVGGMQMYYDYADEDTGISRYLDFYTKTSSTDYARRGIFGLYSSKSSANSDYAYIGVGNVGSSGAQYRFFTNTIYIPNTFYLTTIGNIQLLAIDGNNAARFGSSAIPAILRSNNTDTIHRKYTDSTNYTDYKIWDESNLPNPVQTSDLESYATKQWVTDNFSGGGTGDYLPLSGGTLTGNLIFNNNIYTYWKTSSGNNIQILGVNSNDIVTIGNAALSTRIYSKSEDLVHYRIGNGYKIYDAYNLPNPVQTSDLESYATKTWVGEQGYLTNSSLAGYATEAWVTNKGYLTSSSLDGYAKTTDLNKYLPLSGNGIQTPITGNIVFSNEVQLRWKPVNDTPETVINYDSSSNLTLSSSGNLYLDFSSDLLHKKGATNYKIWDASNISKPVSYNEGTANAVTTIYNRNLGVNGSQWTFLSHTNASTTNIYAPTTSGTSGQILQSQGASKAPTWVDFSGGGVQLSDNNTWTGLNTFQGGLKTSDGTTSYDVWANDILTNPVKYTLNSTGTGYALSFYSKTAGWKEIDTLTTKYLTSATVKSINAGGDGYIGIGSNAYASAAIAEISTNSIFFKGLTSTVLSTNSDGELEYGSSTNYASFNSNNIRIAYPIVSSSGGGGGGGGGTTDPSEGGLTISYYPVNQKNNVTERAKIYCTTTNLYLKDLAKNTQLDFDTDGLYVTTGSTSKVRLATLNDVSGGGGSSVSLDSDNTWTGTNIFQGDYDVIRKYDSENSEIPANANYDINLACGGSYNTYSFGASLSTERVTRHSYAYIRTPSSIFEVHADNIYFTASDGTRYKLTMEVVS